MHPIYENISTATTHYLVEKEPVFVNGFHYKPVGESGENSTFSKRFVHLLAVIGLLVAGILVVSFFFESFRKLLGTEVQKLTKEEKVNIHYVRVQPKLTEWQKKILMPKDGIVDRLLDSPIYKKINAFTWYMKISFEGGVVRKQFVMKNVSEGCLQNVLDLFSNAVNKSLKRILSKEINLSSKDIEFSVVMLNKKFDGKIITIDQKVTYIAGNVFGSDALGVPEECLTRDGFSFASIVEDGEFVHGEYFQVI